MRAFSNNSLLGCGSALLLIGAAVAFLRSGRQPPDNAPTISDTAVHQLALRYRALEAREDRMDQTVWAKEILAEDCGRTFETLWDAINRSTNKLEVVASFAVGEVLLGNWDSIRSLPHGIELREPAVVGIASPEPNHLARNRRNDRQVLDCASPLSLSQMPRPPLTRPKPETANRSRAPIRSEMAEVRVRTYPYSGLTPLLRASRPRFPVTWSAPSLRPASPAGERVAESRARGFLDSTSEVLGGNLSPARKAGEETLLPDDPPGPIPSKTITTQSWRDFVESFVQAGWRLEQIEFRQRQFDTDAAGRPRQSHFYFSAHLLKPLQAPGGAVFRCPPNRWAAGGRPSRFLIPCHGRGTLQLPHKPRDGGRVVSTCSSVELPEGRTTKVLAPVFMVSFPAASREQVPEDPALTLALSPREREQPASFLEHPEFPLTTSARGNVGSPTPDGAPDSRQFSLSRPTGEGRGEGPNASTAGTDSTETRAIIEGDLVVDWAPARSTNGLQAVQRIDARHLTIRTRRGPPAFRPVLNTTIPAPKDSFPIDPLLLYDLDGDGLPEIILPATNLVYRRRGPDHYEPEPLCRYPPGIIQTAVIADFDGDGVADLLCAKPEGLVLFHGSPQGTFDQPGRLVWAANPPLKNAMAITSGDIDHDGDLDVFLAQYDVPTLGQVLRPHYYDANDGFPSYLLLNDGHGNFTDATPAAGLAAKRWRRTYSAVFADLDGDGHLDLSVVSDFAGLDLYRNDGRGQFTDVTRDWVGEPHGFGMAQVLTDFNTEGRLDLLMIGMPSPTVDRLEHLGLWRPDATQDPSMRSRMTYGNRLFLARPSGGFAQTSLNDSIARSGWSWGAGAFDFDNDGFPDVYIANGMQSAKSVREYEPEFWLHDVYIDESIDDATATAYFTAKYARTRGRGWSYGGYEKNRLYLNQGGKAFLEAGYLMGVALEEDSRCVVATDLDGDGRVDLALTTFEVWPEAKQTLRVYRNTLDDGGNWIGFRFREAPGQSPVGVRVTVHYAGRSALREIVTGDSHRSQHPASVHFGLGQADRVDRVEIRWTDGRKLTLREPAVNQYHAINQSVGR